MNRLARKLLESDSRAAVVIDGREVTLEVTYKIEGVTSDANCFSCYFDGPTDKTKEEAIQDCIDGATGFANQLRDQYGEDAVSVWDEDGNCY